MPKSWSPKDIETLRERYADTNNNELAVVFGRSAQAIAVKANHLDLKKSDEFLLSCGFQRGYTPFNKGRKMEEWLSPAVHEKIKANQARTAERNRAAAKPDGSMSKRHDGYHIKVEGQWLQLSHHTWTTHNGPIPEGMAVYHRDGNRFNSDIDNLYIGVKNNPYVIREKKSPEERSAIAQKIWATRRRKANEKYAELDAMLAEIRKSENNIYYKPKI